MRSLLLSFIFLLATGNSVMAQVWTNLQQLQVSFTIKNAGITVNGRFNEVQADVHVDEKNIARSSFSGVIKASTVNTDNAMRDGHLRDKSEFFDVATFPTLTMKSVKVNPVQSNGSYKVDWLLTIKGITKKITTDVLIFPNGSNLLLVSVFKINRRDFNVGAKSLIMSDDVVVTLNGNMSK